METKKFFYCIVVMLISAAGILHSQTTMQSYYDFSYSLNSGNYTELSSPTVLTESGGDDFYLANSGSSATGPGYQIPFNFYYNGEYFTRFGVSSNGFIGLGTEADGVNLSSNLTNPLSWTGSISPSRLRSRISAMGTDIMHLGASYSPGISYKVLGSSPNRILVIQFKGWRRYWTEGATDIMNFQFLLYETSHKIEIVYGPSSAAVAATDLEVGLGGKSTSEYFTLQTTSNWNAPASGQSADAKMTYSQASRPSWGTTYTWTLRTQVYSSATTEQASSNFVLKGQTNQQIVRLKISTTGWVFPFSVTSVTFNTSGTTTLSNITAARVYYTNSDAFTTTTQFGSAISNPSGNMVFNGSQALGVNGVHSFWLVYDISASATTASQYADATCLTFTTNESGNPSRAPSVTNPTGSRQILGGLTGTVTVGQGGDYPTLTNGSISDGLFYAINNLGLAGNVTANIISDISESGTTALNQWTESGGSGYTLTIQPSGAALKTISGSAASGLIRLNGADRVTINGNYSGSGQYLKFQNTNTGTSASVLYLGNTSANNSFKNCIFEGSASGDGVVSMTSSNTSTMIENCTIKNYAGKPYYGINFSGSNNNSTIRGCAVYDFNFRGIFTQGEGITIENNEVYMTSASTTSPYGIYAYTPGSTVTANTVRNNRIHDISAPAGNTIIGMTIQSLSGEANIYNNIIAINASVNAAVYGLELRYSGAVIQANYNSILLGGTVTSGANTSYAAYFYNLGIPTSTVNGKNNSFQNARTNSGGTGIHYVIYFVNNTNTTLTLNYNDYYASGTGGKLGRWPSTDITDLATWKSTTSQDNNSLSADPKYVSAANLKPFTTSPLISAGTPVSGISTDIDGAARNVSNPYIGAYESSQTPATADFVNLVTGNTTIKEGQTSTFYALIEESGITNAAGQGSGVQCWIGYHTSNIDPAGWSNWMEAQYYGDDGNRDKYAATFPVTLNPGTYYIAARFFITNASEYQYGGYSTNGGGTWNGSTNISSELTIQNNTISFASVMNSPVAVKLGVNKIFEAKYELSEVTSQSSACAAVQAWIGYSTTNTDPAGWADWVSASFDGQSGNAHIYKASFGSTFAAGTYYYASRFKLNDDSYVYGGYSSGGGGIWNGTTNVNGQITVDAELPLMENFDNVTAPALPQGWTKTAASPAWATSAGYYNSSPNSIYCSVPGVAGQSADAWLFTPALSLTGGTSYKVVFYAKNNNLYQPKIKGRFGTSATSGGMTSANIFDIAPGASHARYAYTFTPSVTGTYYVGWHHYSMYWNGYYGGVAIDNIEIYPAPAATDAQTLAANNTTTTYSFGTTGVGLKYDQSNPNTVNISVDLMNVNPGINGSMPDGVNNLADKYWKIDILSGTITTGLLTLSIDISGIGGANKPQQLYLLKRTNANAVWQNLGTPAYVSGTVCYWSGINSFSEYTLGGDDDNPLPVELTLFKAKCTGKSITLQWHTETEVDNYGFEIERKTLGGTWQEIGFVTGSGNSNAPKDYIYNDQAPPCGVLHYRLKQIDTDGQFEYSHTIEVTLGMPVSFSMSQNYPNPFNPSSRIDYQLPEPSLVMMEIYSITGERKAVLINELQPAGYYTAVIDNSELNMSSGVYICRLRAGSGLAFRKFMILR